MTTRPTPYYDLEDQEEPRGELRPGVTITILALDSPPGYIRLRFPGAHGQPIVAVVERHMIEPAFYQEPPPPHEPEPPPPETEPAETPPPPPSPTPEPIPEPSPTPAPIALPASAQRITIARRTAAYCMDRPQHILGYFQPGVEIVVLSNRPPVHSYVLLERPDDEPIRALCRTLDLGLSPTPLPSPLSARRQTVPTVREWMLGAQGYQAAIQQQQETGQRILLLFHVRWSEDSQTLINDLLHDREFRRLTREILKVSINPEDGDDEARLARTYEVSSLPTTLVLDAPEAEPRRIRLIRKMYGQTRVVSPERALPLIIPPPEIEP